MALDCWSFFPRGDSVNDGINADRFTLHYIAIDQVICLVSQFVKGALKAKFDVESVWIFVGDEMDNKYYVDLALPFGMHSAPFIFNSMAHMVEWLLVNTYLILDLHHYLDDFTTAGPPTPLSAQVLELSLNQLPKWHISILTNCLPCKNLWAPGSNRSDAIGRNLSPSSDICIMLQVAWSGRTFLYCMIDLLCYFLKRDHPIYLNKEFHIEHKWWHKFLYYWHGISFWFFPDLLLPEADSEGTWVLGFLYASEFTVPNLFLDQGRCTWLSLFLFQSGQH